MVEGQQQLLTDVVPYEHSDDSRCHPDDGGGVCISEKVGRDHGAQECDILNSFHTVAVYVAGKAGLLCAS